MINYLGEKLMGSFLNNSAIQTPPRKPYDTYDEPYIGCGLGDIPSFSVSNLVFSDTPSDTSNAIKWHMFDVDGSILYVCDRVLLNGNNINAYQGSNYINGEFTTIDNKSYLVRAMTPSELNTFILNEDRIFGVPIYNDSGEIDPTIDDIRKNSNHNIFWNWLGAGTLLSDGTVKGYFSPNYNFNSPNLTGAYGFRPVLEVLKEYPVIGGDEGRLGLHSEPFIYNYDVTTYVSDDAVIIKEKLNSEVIKTTTKYGVGTIHVGNLDLTPHWNKLGGGNQIIEIEATNKNGITTTKVAMFNTPTTTYVHHDGLDYFATQLWNSRIKPFVTEMGKKQGGIVFDSSENYTGVGSQENSMEVDNGKCIKCNIENKANTLALFSTDNIKLGKYGVALRVAVNNRVTSDTFELIISKNVNNVKTIIARKKFKSSDLSEINKYQNLYMTFEYTGTKEVGQKLEFELATLINPNSHVLRLDYILISPLLPATFI